MIKNEEIEIYEGKTFEDIKHIDESGNEYWEARELQATLEYKEWRNLELVINKAKIACINSKYKTSDHFVDINKMVKTGDSTRQILDYKLSRYAVI